ncbi:MAG: hypothetical protein IMY80_04815 [Chloroflexi bacterium]|nr:hypothetical protein [Chloroflexota bacterium]
MGFHPLERFPYYHSNIPQITEPTTEPRLAPTPSFELEPLVEASDALAEAAPMHIEWMIDYA